MLPNAEPITLDMLKMSFLLELLHKNVESFYSHEHNRLKISLLSIHPSPSAREIEEDLRIIEELVVGVERNVGCGNRKRACHFLLILQERMKKAERKLEEIDFYELVG